MVITFTGTHGTGKTTMMKEITKSMDFVVASNPRRVLAPALPDFGTYKGTDIISQSVSAGVLSFEIISAATNGIDFLSERSMLDVFAYTELSENILREDKEQFYKTFSPVLEREQVFYFPIEFEMENDGFRLDDEAYRKEIDKAIVFFMNRYNVNYLTVSGSVEERLEYILRAF